MMRALKRYRFAIAMLGINVIVGLAMQDKAATILSTTTANFSEMLSVIPPIFVLLGLLDVWVPREAFVKYMGERSGALGALLAVILGALAAGPLYASFPIASMMLRKGASMANVMLLLGSWSTLKVPMVLFETSALGARFSMSRAAASLPVIFAMSRMIPAIVGPEEVQSIIDRQASMESSVGKRSVGVGRSQQAKKWSG